MLDKREARVHLPGPYWKETPLILIAMTSTLVAMAFILRAMASNLRAMTNKHRHQLPASRRGLISGAGRPTGRMNLSKWSSLVGLYSW